MALVTCREEQQKVGLVVVHLPVRVRVSRFRTVFTTSLLFTAITRTAKSLSSVDRPAIAPKILFYAATAVTVTTTATDRFGRLDPPMLHTLLGL